jgi:hypothetical protein
MISTNGTSLPLAGAPWVEGTEDGPATNGLFMAAAGIAVGADGAVYVPDSAKHTIREIAAGSSVSTLAGQAGGLYVADSMDFAVLSLSPTGSITGSIGAAPGAFGARDGPATNAQYAFPLAIAADFLGNLQEKAGCARSRWTAGRGLRRGFLRRNRFLGGSFLPIWK